MRSDPPDPVRRRSRLRGLALLLGAWLLVLGVCELALRSMVRDSEPAWGELFGLQLPPFRLFPDGTFVPTDREAPIQGLVIDGKQITRADLWGYSRDDDLCGYTVEEGRTSANGWWQSNSLGARDRDETPFAKPPGARRWLAFGDSYTNGSRVPQEEAWPNVLDRRSGSVEVINLGVDGYGVAQSYQRYTRLRSELDHDLVLLTFVPSLNLQRDVNVLRTLLGWKSPKVMPRFVLEGERLELVPPLYATVEAARADNVDGPSGTLREHLRSYDRLYFPSKHESPRVVGRLVVYKLLARLDFTRRERRLRDELMTPSSEAMQVSGRLFRHMGSEVVGDGKTFVLVFLPRKYDIERARSRPAYLERWNTLVASACPPSGTRCIDLLDSMMALPPAELDVGHGSHYGPRANAAIARLLWERLEGTQYSSSTQRLPAESSALRRRHFFGEPARRENTASSSSRIFSRPAT
jgi:hypothetical protein